MSALQEFGFGNVGIPQRLFEKEGTAIHLGVEPNRIDLLTHLVGVSNETIFLNRKEITLDGIQVNIIHRPDLIKIKKSSERLRDNADAEELEKLTDN
ncbi:MAG: hypothetical protein KAS73_09645 [Candidatus Sabulitectum sp.]|nr:hypothetical protein [Candidatus Sabulitectum sp.]